MIIRVLVIDDDKAITELMGGLLQAQGYGVTTTNSGADGVKLAAEKNPHVVLLDLMMPEMDGEQVCKAIRKFSNMPILILSAVSDPSMVASVLDAGADGFLTRPVPASVLIAHIKKMTHSLFENAPPKAEPAVTRRNTQPLLS